MMTENEVGAKDAQAGPLRKQSMLYEACPRCEGRGCLPHRPGEKGMHCFGCKSLYVVETGATAGQLAYLADLDSLRQEAGITAAMLRDGRARRMVKQFDPAQELTTAELTERFYAVKAERDKLRRALVAMFSWQAEINELMPKEIGVQVREVLGNSLVDSILGIEPDRGAEDQ